MEAQENSQTEQNVKTPKKRELALVSHSTYIKEKELQWIFFALSLINICDEYEVSQELMDRFAAEFSCIDASASRMLDLSAAIREALVDVGVDVDNIVDTQLSTVRQNDRFYSYRNEDGTCGRHAAIGVML